jgi:hypothetical protein
MRVRLATIAVREALTKRSCRGHAEAEDTLREDVIIREIFVWGDNHHSPEQTGEILEQAMWSLDPICRAIFVLRDIEGIPVEQTALALNRTVPVLEACLSRARLQLREKLARSFRPALPSIERDLRFGLELNLFRHLRLFPSLASSAHSLGRYKRYAIGRLEPHVAIDRLTATRQFSCLPT